MTAESRAIPEPMMNYQLNQMNNKCPNEIARMAYANSANISKLEIGQSKQEIYRYMGIPQRINSVRLTDNRLVEILFYRIGHPKCESAMDGEFFPVIVSRGKMLGYGDEYYNTMIKPIQYQAVAVPTPDMQAPAPAMVPQPMMPYYPTYAPMYMAPQQGDYGMVGEPR